jgi:hypothetical protein
MTWVVRSMRQLLAQITKRWQPSKSCKTLTDDAAWPKTAEMLGLQAAHGIWHASCKAFGNSGPRRHTMTRTDRTSKLATFALTVVVSATMVLGAVGPATALGHAPIHRVA